MTVTTDSTRPEVERVEPRRLQVAGLSVRYGGVHAVRGIDVTVEPGECVGIVGANGAGKTSTMRALMGLVPRTVDSFTLGDEDLSRTPGRRMVRHGIGYVPEGRHVFPGLTIERNLMLGAYVGSWRGGMTDRLEEVYGVFPVLGDMRQRLAGALSGGQQQMLAIGRALMARPSVILLDEPSMGLSPKLVEDVLAVLRLLSARGLSILLVEQNAKLTFEATERCLVMEHGEVAMAGTSDELRHHPRVRQIYLGL